MMIGFEKEGSPFPVQSPDLWGFGLTRANELSVGDEFFEGRLAHENSLYKEKRERPKPLPLFVVMDSPSGLSMKNLVIGPERRDAV